jgi:ABC-2 type transport system permease protein
MSARRAVWEVARRELVERSRSRAMRASVALLLILSVGGAVAAARLSGGTPTDDIALVGARSVAIQPAIQLQAKEMGRRARVHQTTSTATASSWLRDGTVDVALIDGRRMLVKSNGSQPAVRVVRDAAAAHGVLDRLRSVGLTPTEAIAVLSPQPLPVAVLEPNSRNTDRNRGLILAGLFGLFIVLIFYGQAVAQGVTEEKSSRVVELLLTAVTPRRLLTGKVLGIGLLGLAQLTLAGAAALVAGKLAGGAGLPSAAPKTIALVVLWFILGYAFYSVAFAAVGALVSRQEDLSTAIVPITIVMTGSFYLAMIIANGNPDGTLAQIAAFVPPLAPMVVPARMVLGNMSALGLVLAVAVDLIATAGLILLAARIYEQAILRIGAPIKLRRLIASGSLQLPGSAVSRRRDGPIPHLDVAGRIVAIALLLGGAAIGLGEPLSIAMILAGLLVVAALERRKRQPPPGAAR